MIASRTDKNCSHGYLFQCSRNAERDDWVERAGLDFGGDLMENRQRLLSKMEPCSGTAQEICIWWSKCEG